jgi:hypothetical protein
VPKGRAPRTDRGWESARQVDAPYLAIAVEYVEIIVLSGGAFARDVGAAEDVGDVGGYQETPAHKVAARASDRRPEPSYTGSVASRSRPRTGSRGKRRSLRREPCTAAYVAPETAYENVIRRQNAG